MHQTLNKKLFFASEIGVYSALANICRDSDLIEFDIVKTFFGKQDCGSFENRKSSVCFFSLHRGASAVFSANRFSNAQTKLTGQSY